LWAGRLELPILMCRRRGAKNPFTSAAWQERSFPDGKPSITNPSNDTYITLDECIGLKSTEREDSVGNRQSRYLSLPGIVLALFMGRWFPYMRGQPGGDRANGTDALPIFIDCDSGARPHRSVRPRSSIAQSFAVPSTLPDASTRPSGLNITQFTGSL
jgi:hypothetical protein